MKKNTKFLVLVLALLMMCLCLTGCDELDNMRDLHATWTTEGNTDSITYNGVEYKRIYGSNLPDPMFSSQFQMIFVTEPDVPVLLSQTQGVALSISYDEHFIVGTLYDDYTAEYDMLYSSIAYGYEELEKVLYCKADIYDDIVAKINDGIEYTKYGYEYYTYDEESYIDEYNYYYLTDEECDAINKVVKEVEPVYNSQIAYEHRWIIDLDKISDDGYFAKFSYEIYADNLDQYYLTNYSETIDEYTHYKVPDDMSDIFEQIVEKLNQ